MQRDPRFEPRDPRRLDPLLLAADIAQGGRYTVVGDATARAPAMILMEARASKRARKTRPEPQVFDSREDAESALAGMLESTGIAEKEPGRYRVVGPTRA